MFPVPLLRERRRHYGSVRDLEKGSRDIYTGCIGYIAQSGLQFNVAIQLVLIGTSSEASPVRSWRVELSPEF